MLSPQIRARLEQLNRTALGDGPSIWEPNAGLSPSDRARSSLRPAPERTRTAIVRGVEICNTAGRCLMIDRPLVELWPGAIGWPGLEPSHRRGEVPERIERGRQSQGDSPTLASQAGFTVAQQKLGQSPELAALREHFPRNTLFLDLETCGFAGSMVFLIGLVCRVENELVVRQLLARNYAEERAMLAALWPLVTDHAVLCTYNGKSFDWPMVQDRSTLHRLGTVHKIGGQGDSPTLAPQAGITVAQQKLGQSPIHVDLLHHARRRWRRALPNCRLQTLETFICRRRRSGDIPGSDIPAAYHHFVRTGQTRHIDAILHHNALDLVTLAQLAARLVE